MAYAQPLHPPPRSGERSRASSAASGKYVPPEYQVPHHQQATSASLTPEVGSMSPPQSYSPPKPEMYQSNASYQAPTSQLQSPLPEAPLPIGDHVRPSSRRVSSDRPRPSSDSRRLSDAGRSRRSHHSGRSHHDDVDRGRKSHDTHHKHDAISGDRASVRSRRSHHSHHSLRHHFDDDVGREPEPEPLQRRKTRYPTLSGSLFSLWSSMKKSLDK